MTSLTATACSHVASKLQCGRMTILELSRDSGVCFGVVADRRMRRSFLLRAAMAGVPACCLPRPLSVSALLRFFSRTAVQPGRCLPWG
ncbi:hypothetical protein MTO96_050674 [Rhipicephalus appendiculatus]